MIKSLERTIQYCAGCHARCCLISVLNFSPKAATKWWNVVVLCHQKTPKSSALLEQLISQIAQSFAEIEWEWKVWIPVYHAWNNRTRLHCSLTSGSVHPAPEEPVLWASTETSHFGAMIRALLWGRYCAIVAEFQYNGLAEDLTHWGGRVQARAPAPQPPPWTHTLWLDGIVCVCPAVYVYVHVCCPHWRKVTKCIYASSGQFCPILVFPFSAVLYFNFITFQRQMEGFYSTIFIWLIWLIDFVDWKYRI